MVWRSAAVVMLGSDGRYKDADAAALELLGVDSVDELRSTDPAVFQAVPSDPDEVDAMQRAFAGAMFDGVLAEAAIRRRDGELVRVRTAVIPVAGGDYRALLYPVERPTTNLTPRVYRIADVLAEWRSVERRLVEVGMDSDEGRLLAADVALLRDQYQQLFHRKIGASK